MFLLARIKMYLVAATVVLGAFIAVYFRGKQQGEHEFERDADKHLIDAMRKQREVRDEVETLDDTGLGQRASKWLRTSDQR